MEEKPGRSIADIVVSVTIAVLLYGIGWVFLPEGIFLVGLAPLPICLVTLGRGIKGGLVATLIGLSLVYLFPGEGSKGYFFLTLGLIGTGFGLSIRRAVSPKNTVLLSTFFLLLLFILHFSFILLYEGKQPPVIKLTETLQNTINIQGMALFQELEYNGTSPDEIKTLKLLYEETVTTAFQLTPAFLLLISLLYSWFIYELIKFILKRRAEPAWQGYSFSKWPPFSLWRVPDIFVWGFIIGWAGMLLGEYKGIDIFYFMGINLRYIFQFIFFLIGLSIVTFYLKKYNVPLFIQVLACFLLVVFVYALTFLGVFDTWFDFRRLEEKKRGGEK